MISHSCPTRRRYIHWFRDEHFGENDEACYTKGELLSIPHRRSPLAMQQRPLRPFGAPVWLPPT